VLRGLPIGQLRVLEKESLDFQAACEVRKHSLEIPPIISPPTHRRRLIATRDNSLLSTSVICRIFRSLGFLPLGFLPLRSTLCPILFAPVRSAPGGDQHDQPLLSRRRKLPRQYLSQAKRDKSTLQDLRATPTTRTESSWVPAYRGYRASCSPRKRLGS
jgi:hypothetical protein